MIMWFMLPPATHCAAITVSLLLGGLLFILAVMVRLLAMDSPLAAAALALAFACFASIAWFGDYVNYWNRTCARALTH